MPLKTSYHVCPRNCFDACSMVAHVDQKGRLLKVTGDLRQSYTDGKLCSKGYAYQSMVYHHDRVVKPMLQLPKNSGNWKIISWDEAYGIISDKIIELKKSYNSTLPLGLVKGSGNLGVLAGAMEGFFNSLGAVTKSAGSLCWSAGQDAHLLDFGDLKVQDPQNMAGAKLIVLWGVNPAYTAIHQLPFIQKAQAEGAKVILIDVYRSATANLANEYIRVKPGGDGALALALAQELIKKGLVNQQFLERNTIGWKDFVDWLEATEAAQLRTASGVTAEIVEKFALEMAELFPAAIWTGMGLQRYKNGGQNMRAIHALAAMTGNIGIKSGGVYFPHLDHWKFNDLVKSGGRTTQPEHRLISIGNLAGELENCRQPPLRMLWFSRSNILQRGTDLNKLQKKLAKMELVVTTDYFLTPTAGASDLILPVTSCFEMWDVVPSYWHNWIGINSPAIEPVGESRSELQIARELSRILNEKEPYTSSFPAEGDDREWLEREFTEELKQQLGITAAEELLDGPKQVKFLIPFADAKFATPSGKYHFQAEEAGKQGCPDLPLYVAASKISPSYPYRLLTPHRADTINSQFYQLVALDGANTDKTVLMHPELAKKKKIVEADMVTLYNFFGEIVLYARVSARVPKDLLLVFAVEDIYGRMVNCLMGPVFTDLGEKSSQFKGTAFHENFVNLQQGIA